MQLCVDHLHHAPKILGIALKVHLIGVDDEQFAFLVAGDPILVAFVEAFEVIEAHIALIIAASGLNMGYEGGYACTEVNQQVGGLYL